MSSGADLVANALLTSLLAGKDFTLPDVNLGDDIFQQPNQTGPIFGPVNPITIEQLTAGEVGGDGVFDKLMSSLKAHLKEEYQAARISGAEYTKAYIGLVTAALSTSTQFLLGKDQAYWQALLIQQQAKIANIEATKARVDLETAKAHLIRAQFEAANMEANYGLTKLKLATEDVTYGNLILQGEALTFTNANLLPEQLNLLQEQVEVQRAQTLNTRTDGETVVGMVGKQKDLYTQQITSYQRDSEMKAAKLFTDSWITQKTIDEGLLAPTNFTNSVIDVVLTKLRTNLNMT